jgi:hypothetical protein
VSDGDVPFLLIFIRKFPSPLGFRGCEAFSLQLLFIISLTPTLLRELVSLDTDCQHHGALNRFQRFESADYGI